MNVNCYADHKFTSISEKFRELKDYVEERDLAI